MRLNCRTLKDMTILWAAATSTLLKIPLNATAATILVAAAVFTHVLIQLAWGTTAEL